MNTIKALIAASPAGQINIGRCTTNAENDYLLAMGYTMHRSYWAGEVWGRGAPSRAYEDGRYQQGRWIPSSAEMPA